MNNMQESTLCELRKTHKSFLGFLPGLSIKTKKFFPSYL